MKHQHHVIYVPGILDDKARVQSTLVRLWRLRGVNGHCHAIPWVGEGAWETKLQSLLAEIDRYAGQGHKVSLVGASAGASAILNAYVERKSSISGLVYICAKINAPETVGKKIYERNPAFKTSLYALQDSLKKLTKADKAKMLSLYSPADQTVPYAATVIPDVEQRKLPPLNHGEAILYSLSFGAQNILAPIR